MATDRGVVEDWLSEFKVSPAASAVKELVHPKNQNTCSTFSVA